MSSTDELASGVHISSVKSKLKRNFFCLNSLNYNQHALKLLKGLFLRNEYINYTPKILDGVQRAPLFPMVPLSRSGYA